MIPSLAVAGTLVLPMAAAYAWIGRHFDRRPVSRDAETAATAFTVWWYALAAFTFVEAVRNLAAAAGVSRLPLFTGLAFLDVFVLMAGLWGLTVYLVYLWRGASGYAVAGLSGAYLGCFLVIVYLLSSAEPVGLVVGAWSVKLAYAQPPTPMASALIAHLLALPPVLGALGYLSLYPRVEDPTHRYRILLVSSGVVLWFGAPLASNLLGWAQGALWPLVSHAIGLAAGLVILAAYAPPASLRERLGVRSLTEELQRRPEEIAKTA